MLSKVRRPTFSHPRIISPCVTKNKAKILVLRAQYGKTFVIINYMRSILKQDFENKHFFIIFTQNTIGNTKQFYNRVVADFEKHDIPAGIVGFVSSTPKTVPAAASTFTMSDVRELARQSAVTEEEAKMAMQEIKDDIDAKKAETRRMKKTPDRPFNTVLEAGYSGIRVIATLSNVCRVAQVVDFIESLQYTKGVSVHIFIDEMHEIINLKSGEEICSDTSSRCSRVDYEERAALSPHTGSIPTTLATSVRDLLSNLCRIEIVKEIVGITATPLKLWCTDPKRCNDFWPSLELFSVSPIQPHVYVGANTQTDHSDHAHWILIDVEKKEEVDQYVERVLKIYGNTILSPNSYSFIPATNLQSSHASVTIKVLDHNPLAVSVIINSGGVNAVFIKNGILEEVNLEMDDEKSFGENLMQLLPTLIKDFVSSGQRRPVIITGRMCVCVGRTFTSPETGPFTSAIIFSKTNSIDDAMRDDVYQLTARVFGRMIDWEKYKTLGPPTIYCSASVKRMVDARENMAYITSTRASDPADSKVLTLGQYCSYGTCGSL
jgi:hypothetical protein